MSAAQVRPMSSSQGAGSIRASASLAAHLGTLQRTIPLHARYDNFIGGRWVAPIKGGYFDNVSPTTGQVICQIARSQSEDVELAIDAAHAAADS
jgi:aldehyde dehydrogenase